MSETRSDPDSLVRNIKRHNVRRMVEVPILVHNDPRYNGISVILVEANDGTESFFYKKGTQMVIPDYTEADWELFERLAAHVGWDDEGAYDKPQQ